MKGRLNMDAGKEAIASLRLTGEVALADFVRLAYLPALAVSNARLHATAVRVLAEIPIIGQEPLSNVTPKAMRAFLESLTWTVGVRQSAIVSMFGHLNRAFALAVDCGLVAVNPCDGVDPEPRSFKTSDLGDNPTVSQFAMWAYLPACRVILRGTSNDIDAFSRFVMPAFGDRPLKSLGGADLADFLTSLKARLNYLMYARAAYALEGLCALAIETGFMPASVWAHLDASLKPRRVQQTRRIKSRPRLGIARQYLSKDDAGRVMGALKADSAAKPEARVLLLVMLTGAALGEISRAGWQGFDPQARTLKAGVSGRVIYLSAQAADFIVSLGHGKSPWLFPNEKNQARPCSELAVRRFFEETMLSLGLVGFGINDLRMPYVRFLFERKVPAETVGRLVGLEPSEFSGLMGAAL